ncbi:cellulose binding domain-containing protein [Niastella sp. OAS944]|uniref:cellulose binding domain-containing protein n=1 Tax=Niastella sp. OAS944 TaxID=2664089 RepID=UPI0034966A70
MLILGVIQSRFANTDWVNFNETDDYSYVYNKDYANNSHITLYRNGQLVWGEEPAAVTPEVKVKVYSSSKHGGNNSISTELTINNEGNIPVAYGDLSVRYWFTADGTAALNSWVDYAKLGNSNIITSFNEVTPAATGADKYFEIRIRPTLGNLYPAGNTGTIQYRIAKSDWSNFTFANDYSYKAPAALAVNDHITVYYKGQLIFGTEPTAEQLARVATNTTTQVMENTKGNAAAGNIVLFPNPTKDQLNIQVSSVVPGALVQVYSLNGNLLLSRSITASTQTISLQSLATGIYEVQVRNGNTVTTKRIIKH